MDDALALARPRVAAGALFFNDAGQVLLVKPTYKDGWDIPGGYVEPGESPLDACRREVREELGLDVRISGLLVADWAPAVSEGDKLLFVFDGGLLGAVDQGRIQLQETELDRFKFHDRESLASLMPARLARRIDSAFAARDASRITYLENGTEPLY